MCKVSLLNTYMAKSIRLEEFEQSIPHASLRTITSGLLLAQTFFFFFRAAVWRGELHILPIGGGGVEGYSWHLQLAHKVPDYMAKSIVKRQCQGLSASTDKFIEVFCRKASGRAPSFGDCSH